MRATGLIIPLCVALAGCGGRADDPRGVGRDEVLVQIVATGRTDSRPDEARFTAGVRTTAATAAAASAGNAQAMTKVAAALERLGVNPDDLRTQQIALSKVDYGPDRGRFQANNMIEVRVRDMGRVSEAIAAATAAGANILSGPDTRMADPEAASRSAYAQAYKAARARAEVYAAAAGLTVARVLAIQDTGEGGAFGYRSPPPVVAQSVAREAAPPPPFSPGLSANEVRVRADFALAKE